MELRAFKPSDLDTLCEIDCACFPPGISYSRSEMAEYVGGKRSRTWVAQDDNRIVGFLIAEGDDQGSHIITVDVAPEWRRRGVATVLMDAAEEWAREQGAELIYLETAEDNIVAQRFYGQRGYKKIDTIEHYYSNGAAAWVMTKKLRSELKVKSRKPKGPSLGV